MDLHLRKLDANDWKAVSEIYKQGIETGNATFETTVPAWDEWNKRHLPGCRITAEIRNEVIGWAALVPVSARTAYRGAAEVSIYILPKSSGKGIGKKLLAELISQSENNGIWTLQASIFPENTASIRLHLSCGFCEVGYREKIGVLNGIWRDTVLLERRSKIVGI